MGGGGGGGGGGGHAEIIRVRAFSLTNKEVTEGSGLAVGTSDRQPSVAVLDCVWLSKERLKGSTCVTNRI